MSDPQSEGENDERVKRYVEGYLRMPDDVEAQENLAWLAAADRPDDE